MLSREIVDLPQPKEPGFIGMKMSRRTNYVTKDVSKGSSNEVTISIVEGR